ncbi:ABC transporter periplasmic subunit [Thermoclostridium stercorarium subsp. stercorarium DSM 8532]|nr:ABC transporter periplasmic subunit [Thermoclostridium stercorarium subsp. stercorarium DSM 8532]
MRRLKNHHLLFLSVNFFITILFSSCLQSNMFMPAQSSLKNETEPFPITIMTVSFTKNPATGDSPVVKAIEEFTGTQLNIQWVSNSSYEDQMNLILATVNLPDVMLITSKSYSVVNAARSGAFVEIGPRLQNYKNLRQMNRTVMNNLLIDNKLYGIPRMRPLGRYGAVYRKDWLINTGLSEPKTIEDFYDMLKAFTYGDPDNNTLNDTYGLILTSSPVSLDIIQTWFGVPNAWGENEAGELIPAHLTQEYIESLKFLRKLYELYEEKLVNRDFWLYDPALFNDPFVNGQGGCIVDVLDRANTLSSRMERLGVNAEIGLFGTVSGKKGLRSLSTSGYNGFYVISGNSTKSEYEIDRILQFMDKLNEREVQDLLYHGIEGRHYIIRNGVVVRQTAEGVSESERNDLSMLLTFIPKDFTTPVETNELRRKIAEIQSENEKILVSNPAETFTSEIYYEKGNFLDGLINNARIKFIIGEIDETEFQDIIEIWLENGGREYIREINRLYRENKR